ncbi:hypothetical protein KSP40_PGU011474 [Platanthera guangdongensis]|uniref:Uncharacterized protein n=1 Tax=Platanthera guangdongensis TaxID=2320717 RepID=A0ABR2N447_9ASPA
MLLLSIAIGQEYSTWYTHRRGTCAMERMKFLQTTHECTHGRRTRTDCTHARSLFVPRCIACAHVDIVHAWPMHVCGRWVCMTTVRADLLGGTTVHVPGYEFPEIHGFPFPKPEPCCPNSFQPGFRGSFLDDEQPDTIAPQPPLHHLHRRCPTVRHPNGKCSLLLSSPMLSPNTLLGLNYWKRCKNVFSFSFIWKKSSKSNQSGKGASRFLKNAGLGFKTSREAIEGHLLTSLVGHHLANHARSTTRVLRIPHSSESRASCMSIDSIASLDSHSKELCDSCILVSPECRTPSLAPPVSPEILLLLAIPKFYRPLLTSPATSREFFDSAACRKVLPARAPFHLLFGVSLYLNGGQLKLSV